MSLKRFSAALSGLAMLLVSVPASALPVVPDRPSTTTTPLLNVSCQAWRKAGARCSYRGDRHRNDRYYYDNRRYKNKNYYRNGRNYDGRRYYNNNNGAAIVAGIAGLGLGLALASPPRGYYGPSGAPPVVYQAPPRGVARSPEKIAWCARRYKTYNPDTGYYKPTVNSYRFCG